MPRKKYERRFLSDREIKAGLAEYFRLKRHSSGYRGNIWRELHSGRSGIDTVAAQYDSLRWCEQSKLIERLEARIRFQIVRSFAVAACQTLPDHAHHHAPRIYTQPQLLACVALRFHLDRSYAATMRHLNRHFPERLLLFGNQRRLPHPSTIAYFWLKLPPETWELFLARMEPFNPFATALLRERASDAQ